MAIWVIGGLAVLLASCGKEAEKNPTVGALPQDSAAGRRAYDAGDYQTAFKTWSPLANQGDIGAQFWVGFLYEAGLGVRQDKAEAVKWLLLSSDQGHGDAQARVCRLLFLGQGVPQDYIQAYKWAELGSQIGNPEAQKVRGELQKVMKASEVKEALRLVEEWNKKHKQTQ
jgi:TPR repeat protein